MICNTLCSNTSKNFDTSCSKITDIFEAISVSNVNNIPGTNGIITFDTLKISSKGNITFTPGSGLFILNSPGKYIINFVSTASSTTTTVTIGLTLNGIIISGTIMSEAKDPNTITNITTQTVVNISDVAIISVVNPGSSSNLETFINPNIIIEKVS